MDECSVLKKFTFKNPSQDPVISRSDTAFSFSVHASTVFIAQRVPVEALLSFLPSFTNVYTNLIILPAYSAVHALSSIQEVLVNITFFSHETV